MKPIKLTDELKEIALFEFANSLNNMRLQDGSITFNRKLPGFESEEKARIIFSLEAYIKMFGLIQSTSNEIGWHGIGHRSEEDERIFYIEDIIVYPQTVDGANVNTDGAEYAEWYSRLPRAVRKNIKMQGHSHVDMGVFASVTDERDQKNFLENVAEDSYYICMIWNKRMERNVKIFDLKNNILYENKDIEVVFDTAHVDFDQFIKESKEMVKTKPKTTGYSGYKGKNNGYNYSY